MPASGHAKAGLAPPGATIPAAMMPRRLYVPFTPPRQSYTPFLPPAP